MSFLVLWRGGFLGAYCFGRFIFIVYGNFLMRPINCRFFVPYFSTIGCFAHVHENDTCHNK
ncbi:MAG: hypothetical protein C0P68_009855, partial [Bacillota bacterium]